MNQVGESLLQALAVKLGLAKVARDFSRQQNTDLANSLYFSSLVQQLDQPKEQIVISDSVPSDNSQHVTLVPYSCVPSELLSTLPVVHYQTLLEKSDIYRRAARTSHITLQFLHGGIGSSFERRRYLARVLGQSAGETQMRAKGLDLGFEVTANNGSKRWISIAEAHLLQAMALASSDTYKDVAIRDLVSPETDKDMNALYSQPSAIDPKKTYSQLLGELENCRRETAIRQDFMPVRGLKDGEWKEEKRAPAGHGFFAFYNFIEMILGIGDASEEFLALGNGEDLNALPSPEMIGWMKTNNVPIVMVTTTKTKLDRKGGQISLAFDSNGPHIALLERAQAAQAGKEQWFEDLGLTEGREALFNTNLAIINVPAVRDLIHELQSRISLDELISAITPQTIRNKKSKDGLEYEQIEGAMGSTLLKFDLLCRKEDLGPSVHFINLNPEQRTDFFAPIKSAFDFALYFHSDVFAVTPDLHLKKMTPNPLPSVSLKANGGAIHYDDVQDVLESFSECSFAEMTKLEVEGPIRCDQIRFEGKCRIENSTTEIQLLEGPRTVKDETIILS